MKHQYNQGDMIQWRDRWADNGVKGTHLGVITGVFEDENNGRYSLYTVTWFPRTEKEYYYIKDLDSNEQVSVVVKAQ